jgi:predicted PolB exonuclease-like 3'-5' exonuclease
MIKKSELNKLLYFDLETVSQFYSLEDLKEDNPRLYECWKKREDYYRKSYSDMKDLTSEEIYREKSGLEPEFGKIICASFGVLEEFGEKRFISFCSENEVEILEKCKKIIVNSEYKNFKLCGHNVKGFDVPYLGKRMIYNKIIPPASLMVSNKKPWEVNILDTTELFSFGNYIQGRYLGLELLTCSLGIDSPKTEMEGSKVNQTYWEEKDLEKIKKYCELDVDSVIKVLDSVSLE